jgi:O-antigen/teichoic acid export membrane protein
VPAKTAIARLGVDLGTGYASIAVGALVTLLVVPLYAARLGTSAWGVAALCLTVLGVLSALDLALSPLALRDVAQAAQRGRAYAAWRRYRRLYVGSALALATAALVIVAGLAATGIVDTALVPPLVLVLVQFVFQFANNAAVAWWNGRGEQRVANLRTLGFLVLRHALALGVVMVAPRNALAWLVPFTLVAVVEYGVNAAAVRREAGDEPALDADAVHERWHALAGFGAASALGVATTQIDRVALSLALSLEVYGTYFLVATLMLAFLQLQVPIHRAYMPRIATAAAPRREVLAMWKTSAVLIVLPCLALAALPELVLRVWLHDAAVAAAGAEALRAMLVAVALIASYAPVATWLVSRRRYRRLAAINATVLVAQIVLLAVLLPSFGLYAGALAWLVCGVVQAGFAVQWWLSREAAA